MGNCFLVINSGLVNVNDINQLLETQDKKIVTAMGMVNKSTSRWWSYGIVKAENSLINFKYS
jgi:hypothetical protein